MGRPRSNELARSGHTSLGEHRSKNQPGLPEPQQDSPFGAVPPENEPGHQPDIDQDKPIEKFADRFAAGGEALDPDGPATVRDRLRFGVGFTKAERPAIIDQLQPLDARLAAFTAGDTEMELSVKDRDRRGQQVTLECWISGRTRLVATSSHRGLQAALVEVRDDLRRQINDAKTRTEPRNSRQRRETITAPDHPTGEPDRQ